jgi:hypothetical protein
MDVEIVINKNITDVWNYFIKIKNWKGWYGGGIKKVKPGWKKGAQIFWEAGDQSPIEDLIPEKLVKISGAWMTTSYIFSSLTNNSTLVRIEESSPRYGASFTDGGVAHKQQLIRSLEKLKSAIE